VNETNRQEISVRRGRGRSKKVRRRGRDLTDRGGDLQGQKGGQKGKRKNCGSVRESKKHHMKKFIPRESEDGELDREDPSGVKTGGTAYFFSPEPT